MMGSMTHEDDDAKKERAIATVLSDFRDSYGALSDVGIGDYDEDAGTIEVLDFDGVPVGTVDLHAVAHLMVDFAEREADS